MQSCMPCLRTFHLECCQKLLAFRFREPLNQGGELGRFLLTQLVFQSPQPCL